MAENLQSSSNDNGYQESTPKRSKIHHQDEQESSPDRLSALPEHLLVEILSFLEMKDAVKTSALSKTWKHLWTHVDKIVYVFDDRQLTAKLPEFISFVHRTLMQCTCPNLKKFALSVDDYHYHHELLDEWLQWVFKKNLKFLKLDLIVEGYCFPEWFYHNSSLVKLEINMNNPWWYNGEESVSWPSLKSLQLSYVSIWDGQVATILSGCPVLETIVFRSLDVIGSLNIKYPSVRSLKLIDLSDDGFLESLEIDAPFLKELEVLGRDFIPCFRLINVSSLVYAKFDYTPESTLVDCNVVWPEAAAKLLENVSCVKELVLGPIFIQTLSLLTLLSVPFPLLKCKRVKIRSPLMYYELLGIVCLLNTSPDLDTLIIEVVTPVEKLWLAGYVSSFSDDIIRTYLDGNEDYEWELTKNKSCFEFGFVKSCDKSTNSL
ncbi:hypothetical protein DH2020_041345 [Rehmannia glutinosa]|uniref:F-box domain-containing protein n=1 Tax=Rehmannia glutinosa TaxID=99300 RepID=A0ABR0URN7_REHGL